MKHQTLLVNLLNPDSIKDAKGYTSVGILFHDGLVSISADPGKTLTHQDLLQAEVALRIYIDSTDARTQGAF